LKSALRQRTETSLADVVELLEAMLCFDAWLNQDTFWHFEDTAVAKDSTQFSIKVLMSMCSSYLPTTNSNRWNFPKFLELLHIDDDMSRFGAPTNHEGVLRNVIMELITSFKLHSVCLLQVLLTPCMSNNLSQSSHDNVAIQSVT
jgi:hypothetical protein